MVISGRSDFEQLLNVKQDVSSAKHTQVSGPYISQWILNEGVYRSSIGRSSIRPSERCKIRLRFFRVAAKLIAAITAQLHGSYAVRLLRDQYGLLDLKTPYWYSTLRRVDYGSFKV